MGSHGGVAPQTRSVYPGTYTSSFGEVSGYFTPPSQTVTLNAGDVKTVIGTYEPAPDLTVTSITFSDDPIATLTIVVNATVENTGNADVSGAIDIKFSDIWDTNETNTTVSITSLATGESKNISVFWTPSASGNHAIKVEIDPDNAIIDGDEFNNEKTVQIEVAPPPEWVVFSQIPPYPHYGGSWTGSGATASMDQNGVGSVSVWPGYASSGSAKAMVANTESESHARQYLKASHTGAVAQDFSLNNGHLYTGTGQDMAYVAVSMYVYDWDENWTRQPSTSGDLWKQSWGGDINNVNEYLGIPMDWTQNNRYRVEGRVKAWAQTGSAGPETASHAYVNDITISCVDMWFDYDYLS